MRDSILALFFLITILSYAQDSTGAQVETPKIVSKLFLGKQIVIGDFEIRFVEVMSDSRCPKNVNCVRAGEAKVIVEVFREGEFVEKQLVEITPTTYLYEDYPIMFSSNNLVLKAFNLMPYPINGVAIKNEDYYLQIIIED
jgi:hypothetical protein